MTAQQQQSELLAFGYVHSTYNDSIPIALKQLIQIFYDDWIYWSLQNKKLKQFVNAAPNEQISSKSFVVKGIKFTMQCFPNVCYENWNGAVSIGLIIELPVNVESFGLYFEMKCEAINYSVKQLWSIQKNNFYCDALMGQLSDLKDFKRICFNFMVNIPHIKYKKQCKINYYSPINKMKTYSQFTWKFSDLLLTTSKKAVHRQGVNSDNFDNNNWCLALYPTGMSKYRTAQFAIQCLNFPRLKTMKLKVKCDISMDNLEQKEEYIINVTRCKSSVLLVNISFDIFKQATSLSFSATLKITNIYDENDQMIEKSDYEKYGIIRSN